MRKPQRLSDEELEPFQWRIPYFPRKDRGSRSGVGPGLSPRENEGVSETSNSLNWRVLFGNGNPVEIEVGMGKGLFLLTSAQARPGTNFFGIEIVGKCQRYATQRFALRKITNVKTVCADARWVLQRFIPQASVSAVHVYFPDPWWKTRHKKRRLFTKDFAISAARTLIPGGRLLIASDVEAYFRVMCSIVRSLSVYRELGMESSTDSLEAVGYQTNFERKARQKGTPIGRATFERTLEPILDTPAHTAS